MFKFQILEGLKTAMLVATVAVAVLAVALAKAITKQPYIETIIVIALIAIIL